MVAGVRARLRARLLWAAVASGALGVLLTSRWLEPHPSGVGTHVALGLPPCSVLLTLGLPCPTCGLTTAFAHAARLELAKSLRAHPLGLPLFVVLLALLPACLRWALRAEPPLRVVERLRLDRCTLLLLLSLLGSWVARVLALV